MSTISLSEAGVLAASSKIPLSHTIDGEVSEPFFDYDDEGNPVDYGFDEEPPDPEEGEMEGAPEFYNVALSDFAETAIRIPEAGRITDFSFEGREYLRRIYDTPADRVLLKCGRQVEKSILYSTKIKLRDGRSREIAKIEVGDEVLSLAGDGARITAGRVSWKSNEYEKPCVKITTATGKSVVLATTHPLRTWNLWEEAGSLKVGDVVALDGNSVGKHTDFPKELSAVFSGLNGGEYVREPSIGYLGLKVDPGRRLSHFDLKNYVEHYRAVGDDLYDILSPHLHTDLYWDEIVSIEGVGTKSCFDITVTEHSFVGDDFVTHNSTTLGNKLLGFSAIITNFRSVFVAPSAEQAKVFSVDRIKDVIDSSPLLTAYTSSKMNQAVFFKKFINFSQIRLRYAYLTADRVRGIPADLVGIDEIQDILVDNIPIIEQCAFHSKFKLFVYSGTPKSMDNTLEHYWQNFSTQNEWVVPCDRHGTPKDPSSWHWNVLDEDNIGKVGLVCDKCGEPIDATHPLATWASLQPMTKDNEDRVTFDGYRIPQIMVPWVDWSELLAAQEQYPRAQFYNEKLGMSYDSGVRPITKAQVKACCKSNIRIANIESMKKVIQGHEVYAGIDWGSGENTYTVLSLGAYLGTGNFSIFYIHRYTGPDIEPDRQLDLISQVLAQMNVVLVGADYGGGFHPNAALIRRFGPQKIMKYQYNPQQKRKVYWEKELKRWMCHRTEIMSDIFMALKKRLIDLPNWGDFEDPYGTDILSIFSEYNERTRMTEYKHSPGTTDDAFHSIVYCILASMIRNPRPDILSPSKETGVPVYYD
jgi:hypothetical protein